MKKGRIILASERIDLTIKRLCFRILENHGSLNSICIIGIQPRGIPLANRIVEGLKKISDFDQIHYGKIDITFYRDDFRKREVPLKASSTEMDFLVEKELVILVDDVLYTGRTVQAALTALQDFGRPDKVELLCLVDRRFNRHLPIMSDYTGLTVDALNETYVKVNWKESDGVDNVLLFANKEEANS